MYLSLHDMCSNVKQCTVEILPFSYIKVDAEMNLLFNITTSFKHTKKKLFSNLGFIGFFYSLYMKEDESVKQCINVDNIYLYIYILICNIYEYVFITKIFARLRYYKKTKLQQPKITFSI